MVENFRPDVKDRLGIGYEALKAVNPRIILASISGFGQSGPYKTRAGFDQIAQGMGGLMGVTGEPGTPPMRAGIAVADSSAGVFAATGILIALAERERSGLGQWVETSLLQAQIAMMDFQAARYLVEGVVPPQAGNDHPTSTPMGVVATADGFINIGVGGDGQWRAFCEVIGRPDLANHPDYAKGASRTRHRPQIKALLEPIFAARTSADWLTRARGQGRAGGADLQGRRSVRRSPGPASRHRGALERSRARRHSRGRDRPSACPARRRASSPAYRNRASTRRRFFARSAIRMTRSRNCARAGSCETPMDLNLGGKLALITGGSRGIGRAVGEALAAEGCNLVLVSRSAADLDTARRQLEEKYKVAVRTDAADLADSANVTRLAAQFPACRHPGQQRRRHSRRDIVRRRRGPMAHGLGFESARHHQHDPRLLSAHEGARRRRHHQHHRQRGALP